MSEVKKETVCAVVVTYNRKNLLLECLEALRKQTRPLDAIYLIDNASTDGTPGVLRKEEYIKELPPGKLIEPWEKTFEIPNLTNGEPIKIHYVRMHENTGGAGGYHEGVKRAFEKGYDWLWLMDDDVEPLPYALQTQLSYSSISKCIHPSKIYPNGETFFEKKFIKKARKGLTIIKKKKNISTLTTFVKAQFGCFEGMLIHRDVVSKIGYPEKKMFQIRDDNLYGFLASKYTDVIFIKDVCFKKKILSTKTNSSLLSIYLSFRNLVYVERRKKKNFISLFSKCLYFAFRCSIGAIFKRRRLIELIAIYKGLFDGFNERWGGERKFLKI